MRIFRLIGILVCAIAVSAIAVTTASASLLPGVAKTSITSGSEKATLQVKGGASVTCPKSTGKGEVLSTSQELSVITFGPKCTTAGLPINSLGAEAGVIVAHVEEEECVFGGTRVLIVSLLPLRLEVPSTKLLLTVEGAVLGEVPSGVKQSTFALTITQKEGKNTIETCGKEKRILLTSTDGGAFVQSGEEAKNATLTFGAEEEFM